MMAGALPNSRDRWRRPAGAARTLPLASAAAHWRALAGLQATSSVLPSAGFARWGRSGGHRTGVTLERILRGPHARMDWRAQVLAGLLLHGHLVVLLAMVYAQGGTGGALRCRPARCCNRWFRRALAWWHARAGDRARSRQGERLGIFAETVGWLLLVCDRVRAGHERGMQNVLHTGRCLALAGVEQRRADRAHVICRWDALKTEGISGGAVAVHLVAALPAWWWNRCAGGAALPLLGDGRLLSRRARAGLLAGGALVPAQPGIIAGGGSAQRQAARKLDGALLLSDDIHTRRPASCAQVASGGTQLVAGGRCACGLVASGWLASDGQGNVSGWGNVYRDIDVVEFLARCIA